MVPTMSCYDERSHLLAYLTIFCESHLYLDESEDVGYQNVLSMRFGDRWFGWHIADDDLPLFRHLEFRRNAYDGHTTEEKYAAIAKEVEEVARMNGA